MDTTTGLVVTLDVVLDRLRAKFDPAIDARLLNLYQLGTPPTTRTSLLQYYNEENYALRVACVWDGE
jgi:hypothetical protein